MSFTAVSVKVLSRSFTVTNSQPCNRVTRIHKVPYLPVHTLLNILSASYTGTITKTCKSMCCIFKKGDKTPAWILAFCVHSCPGGSLSLNSQAPVPTLIPRLVLKTPSSDLITPFKLRSLSESGM